MDESPFALIVPLVFVDIFQSVEGHYEGWGIGILLKISHKGLGIIATLLSVMYVALVSVLLRAAYSIVIAREGIPFPSYIETLMMTFTMKVNMRSWGKTPKTYEANKEYCRWSCNWRSSGECRECKYVFC
ncbi:hypothetical protein ACVWXX_000054 [Bacillus toyonensis]